jgi:hypothetical protein
VALMSQKSMRKFGRKMTEGIERRDPLAEAHRCVAR